MGIVPNPDGHPARPALFALALCVFGGLGTAHAHAQPQTPGRYTLRPITVGEGAVRFNGQFSVTRFETLPGEYDIRVHSALGVAYGIDDDFEVGASSQPIMAFGGGDLVGVELSPDPDISNTYLYGRYRFLHQEAIEMAGEVGISVPWRGVFGFVLGLPIRLRGGQWFALDTGAAFTVRFGDPTTPGAIFPFRPRVSAGNFYFGLDTGVYMDELRVDHMIIPLEAELGVAFPNRTIVWDLYVHGGLPLFLRPSRPTPIEEQVFLIYFGFRLYVDTRSTR